MVLRGRLWWVLRIMRTGHPGHRTPSRTSALGQPAPPTSHVLSGPPWGRGGVWLTPRKGASCDVGRVAPEVPFYFLLGDHSGHGSLDTRQRPHTQERSRWHLANSVSNPYSDTSGQRWSLFLSLLSTLGPGAQGGGREQAWLRAQAQLLPRTQRFRRQAGSLGPGRPRPLHPRGPACLTTLADTEHKGTLKKRINL